MASAVARAPFLPPPRAGGASRRGDVTNGAHPHTASTTAIDARGDAGFSGPSRSPERGVRRDSREPFFCGGTPSPNGRRAVAQAYTPPRQPPAATARGRPDGRAAAGTPDQSGKSRSASKETRAEICAACKAPVMYRNVNVGGRHYHRECFVCASCKEPIADKYFAGKDGIVKCSKCRDREMPRCGSCGHRIEGQYYETKGVFYHLECFNCTRCKQAIKGKYHEEGQDRLCADCYTEKYPPKYCAACKQEAKGDCLEVEGKVLHAACFRCAQCRQAIRGRYVKSNDSKYLCSSCQPKCPICMKPLAGQPSTMVDGQTLHAGCFKCCGCRTVLTGAHYKADGKYNCGSCHAKALVDQEAEKEAQEIAKERRLHRRHVKEYRLQWRPELVPCSRDILHAMGVPESRLPRGPLSCVCYNARTGEVGCASAPASAREAGVNISYLATALQVLQEHGREPQFSLDPKDSLNIAGEMQVKKFYPAWLAGTIVGEVLFQADYTLKELCFGERKLKSLPDLPPFFDGDASESKGNKAARQWFVIRRAGVTVAADGVLVPFCELGVESRRLVQSETGYRDAVDTDPTDSMCVWAQYVSARFAQVAGEVPVIGELVSLAKATTLARYLLERGCTPDKDMRRRLALPTCPEGREYSMEVPTLKQERRYTAVRDTSDGHIEVHKSQRSLHGGVDLGVPTKKVMARTIPDRLLEPSERPAHLPLFTQPLVACAA